MSTKKSAAKKVSEQKVSDVKVPEAKVPESKPSEAAAPETKAPEKKPAPVAKKIVAPKAQFLGKPPAKTFMQSKVSKGSAGIRQMRSQRGR